MLLEDSVRGLLGLLRSRKQKTPQLTREQALSARPVRNPNLKWSKNDDDEVVIVLPRRNDTTGKFLAWMFFVPESRPLALDDVGSFVWEHCDGAHTVSDLVAALAAEYKVGKREVEISLTTYLQTLGKRGMVGFLVPRDTAVETGEGGKELLGLEDVGATEDDLKRAQDAHAPDPEPPPTDAPPG